MIKPDFVNDSDDVRVYDTNRYFVFGFEARRSHVLLAKIAQFASENTHWLVEGINLGVDENGMHFASVTASR